MGKTTCSSVFLQEKKYPKSYINVEKLIKINDLNKRYDIVVFQPDGSIIFIDRMQSSRSENIVNKLLIKLHDIILHLKAKYLMVTNG
jgi:hypothetical protein